MYVLNDECAQMCVNQIIISDICNFKTRNFDSVFGINKLIMRTLVALCLVAAVFAIDTNKFAVLLQTGTRGNDAVESVYNLLRDLKTENVNVQAAADKKNNTDEEIFSQVIGDLTNVASLNKQQWERLGAVRTDVEAQVRDGYSWLAWAEARLAEIERRNAQLQDQRCWANGLFVKSLADHADAIAVVQLLSQDVAGWLTNNAGVELVQKAETIADKLSAYSHLFQQDAMQKFQSLAEVKRDGTTGEQVLSILADLQAELEATLATLQEQEIHAAFALAKYVSDTNAEVAWLNSEHERRTGLVEKLETHTPSSSCLISQSTQIMERLLECSCWCHRRFGRKKRILCFRNSKKIRGKRHHRCCHLIIQGSSQSLSLINIPWQKMIRLQNIQFKNIHQVKTTSSLILFLLFLSTFHQPLQMTNQFL
ncbi:unnamed protein product (macronuclear) [Paramecium tetraurelia]|uniref:Uncharacterized protein n=1 Tax=Paramecium tetraurelia TaxID=5888 RepID=A0CM58_PARTE|nr:uncharacterized protein GSPATT00008354001 [Paramecium tetraurelia]CAK71875.1 unnamed protein product [Paramecium tetraurelia]|eukprot:XP_001439272.1 hypothetical protein (macronuclear) [Paramecium tetraurelia strain d4-2]